jgi:hypothetical protein
MTDRPFATAGVTAFFRRLDRNKDAIVIRKRVAAPIAVFSGKSQHAYAI